MRAAPLGRCQASNLRSLAAAMFKFHQSLVEDVRCAESTDSSIAGGVLKMGDPVQAVACDDAAAWPD